MGRKLARVPLTLVTGPVRSGKSRFAEALARASGGPVTYVATARVDDTDSEWIARLARHAASRPSSWRVVETARPQAPALASIAARAGAGETLVVESLGTWLAERMASRFEQGGEAASLDVGALEHEINAAIDALLGSVARTIVVGEEVGWGLVPPYPSGRIFRDVLGRAQQRLAAGASAAYLVVAGFALDLHAHGRRIERD